MSICWCTAVPSAGTLSKLHCQLEVVCCGTLCTAGKTGAPMTASVKLDQDWARPHRLSCSLDPEQAWVQEHPLPHLPHFSPQPVCLDLAQRQVCGPWLLVQGLSFRS